MNDWHKIINELEAIGTPKNRKQHDRRLVLLTDAIYYARGPAGQLLNLNPNLPLSEKIKALNEAGLYGLDSKFTDAVFSGKWDVCRNLIKQMYEVLA